MPTNRSNRIPIEPTTGEETPPASSAATASTSSPPWANKRAKKGGNDDVKPAKAKRARKAVGADEAPQVSSLPDETRLPLADAEVFYVPDFADAETAQGWYDELLKLPDWYRPTLRVYGKDVTQSRKIAAFATDPSLTVKYSGHPVKMNYDYPPLLGKIQDAVEEKLGVTFNHCMLNLYEDGNVYIGNHRDNKENRVIASLSLGAVRTFILTHTSPPSSSAGSASPPPPVSPSSSPNAPPSAPLHYTHTLPLASGSLLVMQGRTQEKWKHQIPKEWGKKTGKVTEGRISLTFRQLVF
ncbi:hypothetical protein JCM6882_007895 [Rhodosporidiobolus microsporus]